MDQSCRTTLPSVYGAGVGARARPEVLVACLPGPDPSAWDPGVMTHVRLVGPDDDGSNLLVATAEGEQFSLPVTEELRALVTHAVGADGTPVPTLPPREVQRRLRAGFTSEDLSRLSGVPVESIRRYEEPILAERAYIAELARATRVGRDPSAPILGELVMDRLASRGVRGAAISWDAWRVAGSPWRVAVAWDAGQGTVRAMWTFDHLARTVFAEDADARWLTEVDLLDAPAPRRHLSPVRHPESAPAASPDSRDDAPFEGQADEPREAAGPRTELLAALQAKRGVREPIVDDEVDEEEFEGFGPLHLREAEVGFASGGSSPTRAGASRKHARGGRVQVPRWDEIVFGATSDES
jgi:hypothetical protein